MDVVSHGLWGGLAFGRNSKRDYWLAFFFGVAPDVFSFGLLTIAQILGLGPDVDWSGGPPPISMIPNYVSTLYDITHSLVVFALVFAIVWIIRKKAFIPLLAWPLHIVYDIFTHGKDFFPTPFLWPLFQFKIDGISWSNPWIFFPNWIALIIAYGLWRYYKRNKKTDA